MQSFKVLFVSFNADNYVVYVNVTSSYSFQHVV